MDTEPTDEDLLLIGCLARGATEPQVARIMRLPLRTLQRRIHRLFDQLGARSRFQAGVYAERIGWCSAGEEAYERLVR